MAGTLYVVNQTGERIVLDSSGLSFTAVIAPGDDYSTIVVKPKSKPTAPPPEPVETKGTLPPRPIDIDMSFIGGLPDDLEHHTLWRAGGAAAPGVASIKGAVSIDHLKSWARDTPEGQRQVLILERPDGG